VITAQVVTSAARTATGQSAAITVGRVETSGKFGLILNCTAASGTTPTLDVTVEWSADGTNFFAAQAADSFTQVTTTGQVGAKSFDVKGPFYRVKWTIGGTTPSFTFTVDAIYV